VSNSVQDRSSQSMLPKAERRALGKIAAAKRAKAKRRKLLMQRVTRLSFPVIVVAVVVGLVWWGIESKEPNGAAEAQASAAPSDTAAPGATLPADADPALQTKPTVTAGGTDPVTALKSTTLIAGTGPAVKSGQTISVNYVGVKYATGEEFDSSWSRNAPASFPIGTGNVIKGWDQGLVGVTVGSRVQLDIPADLAYGENPTGGQPGGALRFVVDILGTS
jgi:FKBP-type peptidyl-prolyl cis-trans isomerase